MIAWHGGMLRMSPSRLSLCDSRPRIAFNQTLFFCLVWHWAGPERVRCLLWKMDPSALLTNAQRAHRHLTLNTQCMVCNHPVEDIFHTFWNCKMAWELWKEFMGYSSQNFSSEPNLVQWLATNLAANYTFNWHHGVFGLEWGWT